MKMTARLVATTAAIAISIPMVAAAEQFRMLNSWSPAYTGVPEISDRFVANVNARSDGAHSIISMGPETVPPFEQFEPVSAGVFDLLFTHGAYHYGVTGVGMAMDAIDADPESRRASGVWETVSEHYAGHGLKLIAMPTTPGGYHILLRGEAEDGRLDGKLIRGTPVYHGLLDSLGASAVVLPAGEIYSALETGVVDGAAWPVTGALAFKWYEVADHYVRPSFGAVTHLVLMDMDRWTALDDETQTFLLEQGRAIENEVFVELDKIALDELASLQEQGMRETQLAPDVAASVPSLWADGVFRLAAEKSGQVVEEMRDLARAAQITQ